VRILVHPIFIARHSTSDLRLPTRSSSKFWSEGQGKSGFGIQRSVLPLSELAGAAAPGGGGGMNTFGASAFKAATGGGGGMKSDGASDILIGSESGGGGMKSDGASDSLIGAESGGGGMKSAGASESLI